ncbi:oxygen-independent coproporphyrinogen III oxidase [bacterium]|nr:oxygen-independent coproporphyrinogen III oxidase [bacterium]
MYDIPKQLIKKYSVVGPRYTSYPTAPVWHEIDRLTQTNWLSQIKDQQQSLSIYVHIPFCWERCTYCGCNVIITRKQAQSAEYVKYLLREIEQLGENLNKNSKIKQLHFGGGTPNFLLNEEIEAVFNKINSIFDFEEDAEIAIELDPCTIRPGQLDFLHKLGVNRLSLGVQDLDEKVQKAVNRIQSREITQETLQYSRNAGVEGINFDLIYGLPFQTLESFQHTVEKVIEMRPDRLAIYNFGYLPQRMIHQRKIDPETLPNANLKLEILLDTINRLCGAGYNYIGMDHFALPEDELSVALNNRTLHRNFMGYTPKSDVNLFGIGMTAISEFNHFFIQNEKKLKPYKEQISASGLSGCRGMELSRDDQIRKWTILHLICHFFLSFDEFFKKFNVDFNDYYINEMIQLQSLEKDGLLEIRHNGLTVINHGQILVRNICMLFDAYLNQEGVPQTRYSKTI